MPIKTNIDPPVPFAKKTKAFSMHRALLYNGSKFSGSQKSKGNSYDVEVVLQVMKEHNFDKFSRKNLDLILK